MSGVSTELRIGEDRPGSIPRFGPASGSIIQRATLLDQFASPHLDLVRRQKTVGLPLLKYGDVVKAAQVPPNSPAARAGGAFGTSGVAGDGA